MKKHFTLLCVCIIACIILIQSSCSGPAAPGPTITTDSTAKKEMSHGELVARGKYLVIIAGCNDCHSPKVMTAQGPVPDTTKLLSGHPANSPLPSINKNALKPGDWILFGPDLTSAVGPWGISFTANLTPDTATGLGAWTEDVFIKTLRTGKHLGQSGGRDILPPMPWPEFAEATDEDLKSIFAYLKALPAISNKVPAPIPPNEVAKMK